MNFRSQLVPDIPANQFRSYGAIAFLSIIFGYFCIPELKNRSLEEIEKMFEANIPLRKFAEYESGSDPSQTRRKEDSLG